MKQFMAVIISVFNIIFPLRLLLVASATRVAVIRGSSSSISNNNNKNNKNKRTGSKNDAYF